MSYNNETVYNDTDKISALNESRWNDTPDESWYIDVPTKSGAGDPTVDIANNFFFGGIREDLELDARLNTEFEKRGYTDLGWSLEFPRKHNDDDIDQVKEVEPGDMAFNETVYNDKDQVVAVWWVRSDGSQFLDEDDEPEFNLRVLKPGEIAYREFTKSLLHQVCLKYKLNPFVTNPPRVLWSKRDRRHLYNIRYDDDEVIEKEHEREKKIRANQKRVCKTLEAKNGNPILNASSLIALQSSYDYDPNISLDKVFGDAAFEHLKRFAPPVPPGWRLAALEPRDDPVAYFIEDVFTLVLFVLAWITRKKLSSFKNPAQELQQPLIHVM